VREGALAVPEPTDVVVYTVTLVQVGVLPFDRGQLRSSTDGAALIRTHLAGVDREYFVVVMLNRKNEAIGINTVSIGSLTGSVVVPREVFKPAILANAVHIMCGHNHPSGDPAPSTEDRQITERLVQAGTVLGIPVIDHVIIGEETHYSFYDNGALTAVGA